MYLQDSDQFADSEKSGRPTPVKSASDCENISEPGATSKPLEHSEVDDSESPDVCISDPLNES